MNNLHFKEFRKLISESTLNSTKGNTLSTSKRSSRKNNKKIYQNTPETMNLKCYYSINKTPNKENTLHSYKEKNKKNRIINSHTNSKRKNNIPRTNVKMFRKNLIYKCQNSICTNFSSFKMKKHINKISNHITIDSSSTTAENHSKSCKNINLNQKLDTLRDRCLNLLKKYDDLFGEFEKKINQTFKN